VVNGLEADRCGISSNGAIGAVVKHSPDDDKKAAGSGLSESGPALFTVGSDAIVEVEDITGKDLFSFLWLDVVLGQVIDIVDIPGKT
jgi:hypothetical protein